MNGLLLPAQVNQCVPILYTLMQLSKNELVHNKWFTFDVFIASSVVDPFSVPSGKTTLKGLSPRTGSPTGKMHFYSHRGSRPPLAMLESNLVFIVRWRSVWWRHGWWSGECKWARGGKSWAIWPVTSRRKSGCPQPSEMLYTWILSGPHSGFFGKPRQVDSSKSCSQDH